MTSVKTFSTPCATSGAMTALLSILEVSLLSRSMVCLNILSRDSGCVACWSCVCVISHTGDYQYLPMCNAYLEGTNLGDLIPSSRHHNANRTFCGLPQGNVEFHLGVFVWMPDRVSYCRMQGRIEIHGGMVKARRLTGAQGIEGVLLPLMFDSEESNTL